MEILDSIAERQIYCIKQGSRGVLVTIKISKPHKVQELWQSNVLLEGISDEIYVIKGVDSFQTVCLSLGFVRNVLEKYTTNGGKLMWSDKSGEIDLDVMFS